MIKENIKSFKELFKRCYYLKEFTLNKFYRTDIYDMNYLFCGYFSLIKYNKKLNTKM